MAWRVLPEYLVEDVIEYHFFVIRYVCIALATYLTLISPFMHQPKPEEP